MIPPIQTSSPSQSASTSTSIAFSRKRSRKISAPRRRRAPNAGGAQQVVLEAGERVDDLHRAPAEHVARAHEQREADARRGGQRLLVGVRGREGRRLQPEPAEQRAEAPAVLGEVDRLGRGAEQRHARGLEAGGELERRLAAELHDHALGLLDLDDREHVLERQRLEVQAVGGVVVGRDRLGVAVDHHRVAAGLAHGHRGVHAAVVELDALADAVGPRAEDHHARALAAADLVRGGAPRPSSSTASRPRTRPRRCRPRGTSARPGTAPRGRARARAARAGTTRSMAVRACTSPRSRRGGTPRARGRSGRRPGSRGARAGRPSPPTSRSSSRERIAFANACWNVRPIAIASPTDFMCVERPASAPGTSRTRSAAT